MTDAFDVCVVGSANLDLVAGTPRLPRPGETVMGTTYAEHPGGKGLNQAVAAARAGARVAFDRSHRPTTPLATCCSRCSPANGSTPAVFGGSVRRRVGR